jgi:hypothetical protein
MEPPVSMHRRAGRKCDEAREPPAACRGTGAPQMLPPGRNRDANEQAQQRRRQCRQARCDLVWYDAVPASRG